MIEFLKLRDSLVEHLNYSDYDNECVREFKNTS